MNRKSFLSGAAILALSGILSKILGAVYRIPLANIIGSEGMGCYSIVYPLYSFLIVISSTGIPIAVSKLVAEECAHKRHKSAEEIFKISLYSLLTIGFFLCIFLLLFSAPAARLVGLDEAAPSFRMLAPSLVFVSAAAAYRGYLQGRQMMLGTAVSQLTEQAVRLTAGLFLAGSFAVNGPSAGASGALLGVTVSEVIGLLVIIPFYNRSRSVMVKFSSISRQRVREIMKKLYKIAFPVTAGASASALISAIDSAVVVNTLTSSGYTQTEASSLFGLLSGFVSPVINMPTVLFASLSMAIVPALSAEISCGNRQKAADNSSKAYKVCVSLALPCSAGLFILADSILSLMYSSLSGNELVSAALLLKILSPSVFFMAVSQICTGILQSAGRTVYPVSVMLLSSLLKLFLGISLTVIPELNIYGAAISTTVCFAVSAVLNTVLAVRFGSLKIRLRKIFLSPAVSVLGMCAYIYLFKKYLFCDGSTWTSVFSGALIYAIMFVLTKGIDTKKIIGCISCLKRKKKRA